jgi:hypothetical protein
MFKTRIAVAATALLYLSGVPAQANQDEAIAEALAALDAALPGTLINNPYDLEWKIDGSDAKGKVVKAESIPGGMAYQARIKSSKPNSWDTAIRHTLDVAIDKGDRVQVSFWARTAKPATGAETADFDISVGRNVEPYDTILTETIKPADDWDLYTVTGTANRDFGKGKANVNYNLARARQTVEFGQFYVTNLGAVGSGN